jgi:hypothetical protein
MTPLPGPESTRQQPAAQLSLNGVSSTAACGVRTRQARSRPLTLRHSHRLSYVRLFASPPAPHFFLFFFKRMHACFSLGIRRSLSLFRCCLVRSSGSFKIHTRICLPRVTGWSDGEREYHEGPSGWLVQSVLLRRSGCIDIENADTSSGPRTQTVQRVARTGMRPVGVKINKKHKNSDRLGVVSVSG